MRGSIRRRFGPASILVGLALLSAQTVLAAPGDLDGSFDDDGMATLAVAGSGQAKAVAIHGGKVVVAGTTQPNVGDSDFVVARFTAGGDPDPAFGGGDGFVTTDFGGNRDFVDNGLAVLPSGKILVAGTSRVGPDYRRLSLARYRANGTLDPDFGGGDGKVTRDYPGLGGYAYDLLLLPDGKFIVAGSLLPDGNECDFAIWRFKANGKIDKTFGGGDGMATHDLGPGCDEAWRLLLMPDGDIVAGGWVEVGSGDYDVVLVRYNAGGNIDKAFGIEGVLSLNPTHEPEEYVNGMVRSGNKIIVVSPGQGESGDDVVILRLRPNGARDSAFGGGDGEVVRDLGGDELAADVAIQEDGKIVVAGRRDNESFVARFKQGGAPDLDFGIGGLAETQTPGEFNGIALQPNGRIVAVGNDNTNILVARFLP